MVVVASYKCDVLSIRVLSNAYSTHTHTHTWNVTSSQQTQERQQCRSLFWLLFVALSNQIQNVCCVHCLILIVLNYVFIYFWWYWLLLCRHVFGMLKRLNREYCAAKQNCGVLWFFSGEWTTDFWDLPDFFRLYETSRSFCRTSRDLQRLFTPEETFWDFFWAEDGTGDANAASGSKNARQILWSLKSLWKSREVRQKSLKSHQVRRKIAASTLSHPWANKTRSAWLPTRQSAKFAKYSFRSSSRIPKIRSGVHRKSHWRQSKKTKSKIKNKTKYTRKIPSILRTSIRRRLRHGPSMKKLFIYEHYRHLIDFQYATELYHIQFNNKINARCFCGSCPTPARRHRSNSALCETVRGHAGSTHTRVHHKHR